MSLYQEVTCIDADFTAWQDYFISSAILLGGTIWTCPLAVGIHFDDLVQVLSGRHFGRLSIPAECSEIWGFGGFVKYSIPQLSTYRLTK